jgi:DNA-binding MarR family transcriptional regulator
VLLASLWWLEDHGEAPTQARLAQQAGTDSMMTSQVIRKLEGRDLVARALDPADSRARQLQLTEAGRVLVARALADVEAADDEYFASLGSRRPPFVEALRALGAPPTGREGGGRAP